MFREQYNALNKQISPDEDLLRDTIRKSKQLERRNQHKVYLVRKPAIALMSICLCFSLAMPALAATVEPVYRLMYRVSPTVAQFFMPVQKSDEDNGIKMEVVSTYIHDNVAEIYITLQDLTGQRIDETTDLYDSYSINRPFDSSASCQRIGYDASTNTFTFLITIEEWGSKDIEDDKITFSIREFLSHKKTYEDVYIPYPLALVNAALETQQVTNITGGGGGYDDYKEVIGHNEYMVALIPEPPMSQFPVEGIDLTGISYIDDKLHIQTAVTNNSDKDNHGSFYLKDSHGNKILPSYTFGFVNQYDQPGRIDYDNYVFDIPSNEIANYTLHGNFYTSGMITKGDWRITFPLE